MDKKLLIPVFAVLIAASGIFFFYKKIGAPFFATTRPQTSGPSAAPNAAGAITVVPGKTIWDYKVVSKITGLRIGVSVEPCSDGKIYKSIEKASRAKEACILNLAGGNLAEFPAGILKFAKLTELHLENNRLTKLPPEIGSLTNLTALYLSANRLTELPPEIGNLTNLAVLQAQNNKLASIPPEIGNLKNLAEFSLFANNLTDLPSTIGELQKLKFLGLKGNNLSGDALAKFQKMLPKTKIVF